MQWQKKIAQKHNEITQQTEISNQKYKADTDERRRKKEFSEGDPVMILENHDSTIK